MRTSPPRASRLAPRAFPRGLTLIELLVTIFILVAVLAGVIPMLSPNNEARQVREGARQLNSMIAQAQAQAARDGRNVGVAFRENIVGGDASGAALEAYFIAEPYAYAGFSENSYVRLHVTPLNIGAPPAPGPPTVGGVDSLHFCLAGTPLKDPLTDPPPPGPQDDPLPPNSIRRGDLIEVGGFIYKITDLDRDGDGTQDTADNGEEPFEFGDYYTLDVNAKAQFQGNWVDRGKPDVVDAPLSIDNDGWTNPRAYRVVRQPSKTSEQPIQFPRTVGIDLNASGIDIDLPVPTPLTDPSTAGFGFTTLPSEVETRLDPSGSGKPKPSARPLTVAIMFAPTGRIDGLYLNGEKWTANYDQLHLLVGLAENGVPQVSDYDFVGASADDEQLAERRERVNWLDPEAIWVSIDARSGRLVTNEVNSIDPRHKDFVGDPASNSPEEQVARQILGSRGYARNMSTTGGR